MEHITRLNKGFISYFKNNSITIFLYKKDANHGLIAKKTEEKITNLKSSLEILFAKKRPLMNGSVISNSFGAINHYKTWIIRTKNNCRNFGLLVFKNHLPIIQFVDSI